MVNEGTLTVERLFHDCVELSPTERRTFLSKTCKGDERLYNEVQSLLEASDSDPGFLDKPVLDESLAVIASGDRRSLTGIAIGNYDVGALLGGGGMGEVYLAVDRNLDRQVALKFLSADLVDDDWAVRQLTLEARALAALIHPNICQVYKFEEVEDHRFIVMQYVRGISLDELVASGIERADIVSIAVQILDAIVLAHAHGIIHRDIKPGNIIIDPDKRVKVLDFGLAKIVDEKNKNNVFVRGNSIATRKGTVLGTPAYMSPEQVRGQKLDVRTDIFSFGTLLFECLAGKNPFERSNYADTAVAITTTKPALDRKLTVAIDVALLPIIRKCLEPNVEERYQSASELLFDLKETVSNPPSKWRRIPAYIFLSFVLILVAGLGYYISHLQRDRAVAILPFANDTRNPDLDYLADGIAEEISGNLATTPGYAVVPYRKVTGLISRKVDPSNVGGVVRSDLVVTGRIFDEGGGIKVQTKLIDSTDGTAVRSFEHLVDLADLPALKQDILNSLFAGLELASFGSNGDLSLMESEVNKEAYRLVVLGRHLWRKRDKDNIQKAIIAFEAAIDHDPSYSRAYSGLADSYVLMNLVAYGTIPTNIAMNKAKAAAKKAIELDPLNAEAHTSLGIVLTKYDWNWKEAEREFKQAISIDDEYSPAHYWLSGLLSMTGKGREAVVAAERARELDPFFAQVELNLARVHYFERDYPKALDILTAPSVDQTDTKIQYMIGLVYIQTGEYEKAMAVFDEIGKSNRIFVAAVRGFTFGRLGNRNEALKIIKELKDSKNGDEVFAQEIGMIYAGMNDKEGAFKYLEKAFVNRSGVMIAIKVEPLFDPIRDDVRFADLLRKMALDKT